MLPRPCPAGPDRAVGILSRGCGGSPRRAWRPTRMAQLPGASTEHFISVCMLSVIRLSKHPADHAAAGLWLQGAKVPQEPLLLGSQARAWRSVGQRQEGTRLQRNPLCGPLTLCLPAWEARCRPGLSEVCAAFPGGRQPGRGWPVGVWPSWTSAAFLLLVLAHSPRLARR